MKIKPLGERVLIEQSKMSQKTASGILVPENKEKTYGEGEVTAVGDGKEISQKIKKGDKVLFEEYATSKVEIGKQEFVFLELKNILGVIKK